MPPASKKLRLAKSKSQSESRNCFSKNIETSNDDLVDLFEIDVEESITVNDRELQGITDDVTSAIYSSNFLKWHEGADKSLRGTYQKNSLTTEWRKRKTMKESFDSKGSYRLTEKGFIILSRKESVNEELEPVEVTSKKIFANTISLLKLAFNNIKEEIAPFTCISDSSLPVDYYELCKLKSVKSFLRHRLSGTMIRKYAKEYINFQSIALHQQGKNAIHFSLFFDEDFKVSICKWIQQQKPESRSTILVKKHINEVVIPKKLGIPGSVSMSTVWKYLHEWGYIFRKNSKDIYYDGHEKANVIEYRKK
ncbi:hypothetical protein PHYBLDRAFT_173320 [Phycomyces blakesleeanus NRRL 1555(-)]|uniref:Uncharacterized protein n=1 Tax=Phycomyces blakesleeanus (strain ATCC 8743b / DSM 1359 / FGSC 10004 / NBRC 33097 / NRRL 1555) TaxID=763407 RepID=A0A162N428_PHYB8|nr:hypothetical protein PHYBLDRAFT_173320 [Phycomyces blakesleeanus NRRL 1555(-)]OAD68318.1 hypothetical protein PHYBLDRAFT_173320 [Phycomyces blakesleeanus NRRL 1555(-)]|eukprot:XP_018286358.1 hypothetical protein PHYBLDRAFT_173320 [Phycomyces blakesleeanus NRRL 1555(-)]